MPGTVRMVALSLACSLVACRPGSTPIEPEVEPGSTPITEAEGGGAELAIVVVPQAPASEPSEWLFEPGGRRLASTELGDCSIWDIETGRLIHSLPLVEPTPAPCADWLPSSGIYGFMRDTTSADGKLSVEFGASVGILGASGQLLRELECPRCANATMMTWSVTGHQVAFLSIEPLHLDVWDADTGKQIRSELIAAKGPLDQFAVAWLSAGPVVVLSELSETSECSDEAGECEFDDDGNIVPREVLARRALVSTGDQGLVEIDLGTDQGTLDDLELDPEGKWIYWTDSYEERRSGTSTWLYFVGLGEQTSELGWEHYDDYDDYEGSMTREGQWRTDGATHWAVTIRHEEYDMGLAAISWETTLTSPPLGRRSGEVTDDTDHGQAEAEVELFGFAGDALRFVGEVCVEETCTALGPKLPPDCSVLDIASNHGVELLDCGGRVQLRNPSGMQPLPLDANTVVWWWGRSGALVLDDGATFMVIDAASGRVGLQRNDVTSTLDGKLGSELDRMVVLVEEGFELLDLTNPSVPLRRPDLGPSEVAFSPSGDRLAVLEGDRIQVLELPSGKSLASWPVGAVDQLAFRQDGKVIYVGSDLPEAGFDAASGEPLNDPLVFAKIAEAVEQGGEIDPSWRWIMHDELGELVRTLDGRTLEWLEAGAWLPDSGQYTGSAPALAFRIGSDPWVVPEFDAVQLDAWLQDDELVETFLAGTVIAKPVITVGELEVLRAKVRESQP